MRVALLTLIAKIVLSSSAVSLPCSSTAVALQALMVFHCKAGLVSELAAVVIFSGLLRPWQGSYSYSYSGRREPEHSYSRAAAPTAPLAAPWSSLIKFTLPSEKKKKKGEARAPKNLSYSPAALTLDSRLSSSLISFTFTLGPVLQNQNHFYSEQLHCTIFSEHNFDQLEPLLLSTAAMQRVHSGV